MAESDAQNLSTPDHASDQSPDHSSGNRPRLTGERVLLGFAAALLLLGLVQFLGAGSRAEVEVPEDEWAATALHDTHFFEGILTENYVAQFWEPLTSYEGTPLYRRSHGTRIRKPAFDAIAVGETDSGHTLYRASWLKGDEAEGVYVLKLGPADDLGRARFVEVGPQKYFREEHVAPGSRRAAEPGPGEDDAPDNSR